MLNGGTNKWTGGQPKSLKLGGQRDWCGLGRKVTLTNVAVVIVWKALLLVPLGGKTQTCLQERESSIGDNTAGDRLGAGRGGAHLPESRWVHPQGLCDHHVQVGQAFLEAAELRGHLMDRDKGKVST